MKNINVSDDIRYIGVDDKTLDLFENQYVVPKGISYNSYVILDEKVAVMDTVDSRGTNEWLANLDKILNGRGVDYIIVHHMEPDHSGSLMILADKYPQALIVGNAKTFSLMSQFFDINLEGRKLIVKEGDTLSLGAHTLQFFMAPMVHWPEVMVSYELNEKVLFSADAFGKFGTLDTDDDWFCEARRYYMNIVGKYGAQVQALLKKTAALDIKTICPLHGPVLKDNIGDYIERYNIWSSYEPEDEGVVIAYASTHGNTKAAAEKFEEILKSKGTAQIVLFDLSRCDIAEAVECAFRYSKLVVASSTYDGGIFPCMEFFLNRLKSKNYQNRKVAVIENGSWAPLAGKQMKAILETMKNVVVCENMVTIRSAMKAETESQMNMLADELLTD